jgi:hypothetical protein
VTLTRTHTDKIYKDVTTTTVSTPRVKKIYGDGREEMVLGTPVTTVSVPVKTHVRDETRSETITVSSTVENRVASTNNSPGEVVSTTVVTKTIASTITLDPTVVTTVTYGDSYVETAYTDSDETTTVTDGTPVVTPTQSNNVVDSSNPDGSVTRKTYTTTVTTTVVPRTTTVSKVRTYTDTTKKVRTTVTATTPNSKITYTDGTFRNVTGATVTDSVNVVETVGTANRTETITVSSSVENITTTASNTELVSTEIIPSIYYSDLDPNLGTKTVGYSATKSDYETNEYLDRDADGNLQGWANGGKKQINAADAYSRGWTGKGVKIAVADTGYDTDHSEFAGQVFATMDYTGTGINDTRTRYTRVGFHLGQEGRIGHTRCGFRRNRGRDQDRQFHFGQHFKCGTGICWAADQGAVVGNLSANSNYDSTFRSNLTALSDGTYKSTDSRYDYSTGTFYNMQTPAQWKAATDKGMVIVNSAGNQGLSVSANPGYFATAVDSNGDLVLGGKMLIVGAVDQNGNMASWSNQGRTHLPEHQCRGQHLQ